MLKPKTTLITFFIVFAFSFSIFSPAIAQDSPVQYNVNSNIWFEGTSTVRDWACKTVPADGSMAVPTKPKTTNHLYRILDNSPDTAVQTSVTVPVDKIKCEQGSTMNKHMRNALQADQHPSITFELNKITNKQLVSTDTNPTRVQVNAHGELTIAGKKQNVVIPMTGRVTDTETITVSGRYALELTNYNIDPPTVMWTITVYEDITLHIDAEFSI